MCISDALRDLVSFIQFKKREKHPLKVTLLHGCFSHFLNCTNGTKSRKASHLLYFQTSVKPRIFFNTSLTPPIT